jgi:hypothetical protein
LGGGGLNTPPPRPAYHTRYMAGVKLKIRAISLNLNLL